MATEFEKHRRRVERAQWETAAAAGRTADAQEASARDAERTRIAAEQAAAYQQREARLAREAAEDAAYENRLAREAAEDAAHENRLAREAVEDDIARRQEQEEYEQDELNSVYDMIRESRSLGSGQEIVDTYLRLWNTPEVARDDNHHPDAVRSEQMSAEHQVKRLIEILEFDNDVQNVLRGRTPKGSYAFRRTYDGLLDELKPLKLNLMDAVRSTSDTELEPFNGDAPEFDRYRDVLDVLTELWVRDWIENPERNPRKRREPAPCPIVSAYERSMSSPANLKREQWGKLTERSLSIGMSGHGFTGLDAEVGKLLSPVVMSGNGYTTLEGEPGQSMSPVIEPASRDEVAEFLRANGVEVEPDVVDDEYQALVSTLADHDNCLHCTITARFRHERMFRGNWQLLGVLAMSESNKARFPALLQNFRLADSDFMPSGMVEDLQQMLSLMPDEARKAFAKSAMDSLTAEFGLSTPSDAAVLRQQLTAMDAVFQREEEFRATVGPDWGMIAPQEVFDRVRQVKDRYKKIATHKEAVSAYAQFRHRRGDALSRAVVTALTAFVVFLTVKAFIPMFRIASEAGFATAYWAEADDLYTDSEQNWLLGAFFGLLVPTGLIIGAITCGYKWVSERRRLKGKTEETRPEFYSPEEVSAVEAELTELRRRIPIWWIAMLLISVAHIGFWVASFIHAQSYAPVS